MRPAAVFLLTLVCLSGSPAALADPKSHYMIHCMGCHLVDGSGQPPDVPAFDETLGRFTGSERGRAYLVQVPGASQAPISNADLAAVINWMLNKYSSATLPADFSPFTEEEVAGYRSEILSNPVAERERLLADHN